MLENIIQQMNVINISAPTTINVNSNDRVVGSVIAYMGGGSLPEGFLLCDGTAISRSTYDKLFLVIGTTYGTGDGSTTFNLPNLVGKFLEGDDSNIGTVKSAGLPNVAAHVTLARLGDNGAGETVQYSQQGPFLFSKYTGANNQNIATTTRSGGNWCTGFDFDLSKSNSIYGNSETVQPPAITCKFIICYS